MKITRLEVSNYKRIFAIDITPSGSVIIIGGENKAGKSSTLDSIESGLRGKRSFPADPIRHGADKATIRITLSPSSQDPQARVLIATRIITEKNQYFEVKYEDGSRPAGTPQSIMDKLLGAVSFDFMDFLRLKPDKQHAMLQEIVGLDFTKVDAERSTIYDARRDLNRDIERIKGSIALIEVPEDTPDEPIDVDHLMHQAELARQQNTDNEQKRARLQIVGEKWQDRKQSISARQTQIRELELEIQALTHDQKEITIEGDALGKEVDELEDIDLEPIDSQIRNSNEINIAVRNKQEKELYKEELKELNKESKKLTDQINAIDQEKQTALNEAEFPVPGLSFDENGVTYNGIPFDQASSMEQTKVSLGMGIALNPELRVLLVREASVITPKSLEAIAEFAKEKDVQLWLEDCRATEEQASVIIEDGSVKPKGGK